MCVFVSECFLSFSLSNSLSRTLSLSVRPSISSWISALFTMPMRPFTEAMTEIVVHFAPAVNEHLRLLWDRFSGDARVRLRTACLRCLRRVVGHRCLLVRPAGRWQCTDMPVRLPKAKPTHSRVLAPGVAISPTCIDLTALLPVSLFHVGSPVAHGHSAPSRPGDRIRL
jgi:hypothetical protein